MRLTTLGAAGSRLSFWDDNARLLLLEHLDHSFFVMIYEFSRVEIRLFRRENMLRKFHHIRGNLHIWQVVKEFLLVPNFVSVT